MEDIQLLINEIAKIKGRNRKVEADKAWETSWTRRLLIAVLTYIIIVLFFFTAGVSRPFINAIVPTLGFLLSTLSVSTAKSAWLKNYRK